MQKTPVAIVLPYEFESFGVNSLNGYMVNRYRFQTEIAALSYLDRELSLCLGTISNGSVRFVSVKELTNELLRGDLQGMRGIDLRYSGMTLGEVYDFCLEANKKLCSAQISFNYTPVPPVREVEVNMKAEST